MVQYLTHLAYNPNVSDLSMGNVPGLQSTGKPGGAPKQPGGGDSQPSKTNQQPKKVFSKTFTSDYKWRFNGWYIYQKCRMPLFTSPVKSYKGN